MISLLDLLVSALVTWAFDLDTDSFFSTEFGIISSDSLIVFLIPFGPILSSYFLWCFLWWLFSFTVRSFALVYSAVYSLFLDLWWRLWWCSFSAKLCFAFSSFFGFSSAFFGSCGFYLISSVFFGSYCFLFGSSFGFLS